MDSSRVKGLTLIELLVAIGIAAILTGTITLTLKTGFDSYLFGQQEVLLEKMLDESLGEIADGGFESYGIKDSLEILSAQPTSVTFVPLWVDDNHVLKPEHKIADLVSENPFILSRPLKSGTPTPIAEISETRGPRREAARWQEIPIVFIPGTHDNPRSPDDEVFLENPVPFEGVIRFAYQPDATHFPDCAMTIKWENGRITRTYKNREDAVPKYEIPGVLISDFKLQYYDNTNTEVKPEKEFIPNITAVRIELTVSLEKAKRQDSLRTFKGFTFVNLRNTRTGGKGILIQKGTRIKMPNSRDIRVFSIANIAGFKKGDIIELEARPEKGLAWKAHLELDFDPAKNTPLIKKYSIEYPPGITVYSNTINLTTDLPLDFLALGAESRYDYDFDKEGDNVVNLEGNVELVATRMDAQGAALFIRP